MHSNQMIEHPSCKECGKEIRGIDKILFTLAVEPWVFLHAVCYERLLENAGADK